MEEHGTGKQGEQHEEHRETERRHCVAALAPLSTDQRLPIRGRQVGEPTTVRSRVRKRMVREAEQHDADDRELGELNAKSPAIDSEKTAAEYPEAECLRLRGGMQVSRGSCASEGAGDQCACNSPGGGLLHFVRGKIGNVEDREGARRGSRVDATTKGPATG